MDAAAISTAILQRAGNARRFLVAIAGPPAAGKSTLSAELVGLLPAGEAVVVPMDGFHYDDSVLAAKGLSARKGSPPSFDYAGFATLLQRLRAHEPETAIPVFDRSMELARAGAEIVDASKRFILVEGNYLLLDEAPWSGLAGAFDFSIFVDEPREALEQRLVARWRHHGRPDDAARRWIDGNDLPNADLVLAKRRPADLTIRPGA